MSVNIDGTTITMTRGDTLNLKFNLSKNGESYVPSNGDSIRFAMKKNIKDEECIILKDIPIFSTTLRLDPEDTKSLPQPSKYVYDVQITFADGTVNTFIDKATFKITEEVE